MVHDPQVEEYREITYFGFPISLAPMDFSHSVRAGECVAPPDERWDWTAAALGHENRFLSKMT